MYHPDAISLDNHGVVFTNYPSLLFLLYFHFNYKLMLLVFNNTGKRGFNPPNHNPTCNWLSVITWRKMVCFALGRIIADFVEWSCRLWLCSVNVALLWNAVVSSTSVMFCTPFVLISWLYTTVVLNSLLLHTLLIYECLSITVSWFAVPIVFFLFYLTIMWYPT